MALVAYGLYSGSWVQYLGAVTLGLGLFLRPYFKGQEVQFWKLTARFPDDAYDWFVSESQSWLVADETNQEADRPSRENYVGPFRLAVPKLGGKVVTVYGRRDSIEDSQRRFAEMMRVHRHA